MSNFVDAVHRVNKLFGRVARGHTEPAIAESANYMGTMCIQLGRSMFHGVLLTFLLLTVSVARADDCPADACLIVPKQQPVPHWDQTLTELSRLKLTLEDRPGIFVGQDRKPGLSLRGALLTSGGSRQLAFTTEFLQAREVFDPLFGQLPDGSADRSFLYDPRSARTGLSYRQYGIQSGRFRLSIGQLNVADVAFTGIYDDVTSTINSRYAEQAKKSVSLAPVANLQNLKQLSGSEVKDYDFAYEPLKGISVAGALNKIQTPEGSLNLEARRLDVGRVRITQSSRKVDKSLTDASLTAMGRKDLISAIGSDFNDTLAFWQLSPSLTVQRYESKLQKDDDDASKTRLTKDTLDLGISERSAFHIVNEQSQNASAAGDSDSTTQSRLVKFTHRQGKHTKASVSHKVTNSRASTGRTDTVTSGIELESAPFKKGTLAASFFDTGGSAGESGQTASLSLSTALSERFRTDASGSFVRTEKSGLKEDHAFAAVYGKTNAPKVSISSSFQKLSIPDTGQDSRNSSTTLRVIPTSRLEFEILRKDIFTDSSGVSRLNQYTTRTTLAPAVNLVLRVGDLASKAHGEALSKGLMLGLQPFGNRNIIRAGIEQTSLENDHQRLISYLHSELKPLENARLKGGVLSRRETGREGLDSWDWGSEVKLFRRVTLGASQNYNKPLDTLFQDSLLPISSIYQPVDEKSYNAALDVSRHWKLTAALQNQEPLDRSEQRQDTSIGVLYDQGTAARLELSVVQRRDTAAPNPLPQNSVRVTFVHRASDSHEFALSGWYSGNDTNLKADRDKRRIDLSLRLRF